MSWHNGLRAWCAPVRRTTWTRGWLQHSTGRALRSFAGGITRDEAAVQAALRLPWSQGQVEGQVNRTQLVKRLMFGRGSVALLRRRVLYSAVPHPQQRQQVTPRPLRPMHPPQPPAGLSPI
jgi:hypothetical protein